MEIDIFAVIQIILDIIKKMDSFSISLGSFSFSLWDLVVAMGILDCLSYISGMRGFGDSRYVDETPDERQHREELNEYLSLVNQFDDWDD